MIDVKLVDSDTTPMSTPNSSRAGSDDEVSASSFAILLAHSGVILLLKLANSSFFDYFSRVFVY